MKDINLFSWCLWLELPGYWMLMAREELNINSGYFIFYLLFHMNKMRLTTFFWNLSKKRSGNKEIISNPTIWKISVDSSSDAPWNKFVMLDFLMISTWRNLLFRERRANIGVKKLLDLLDMIKQTSINARKHCTFIYKLYF